jgi:hypothetical protein
LAVSTAFGAKMCATYSGNRADYFAYLETTPIDSETLSVEGDQRPIDGMSLHVL